MVPDIIHQCIKRIARLPGVGQRQASRIVFSLLRSKDNIATPLVADLERLLVLQSCSSCLFPHEPQNNTLCNICADPRRDNHTIMVIEKETDLLTIEKAKIFNGTYFILGGLVNPIEPDSEYRFNLQPLLARITTNPEIKKEIVFALSPTATGNLTATHIGRSLKEYNVAITHLGKGLPNGGDVEFTDEETIIAAFTNRR
ncbi:MAG: recombination protein RecR [Parcubacteria group bacterium]|nr:recombination protein RecR [Parcubacteria group bacterium]